MVRHALFRRRQRPQQRGFGSLDRVLLVFLAAAAVVFGACRPSAQELTNSLPTEINGQPVVIQVVDSTLSGLVTDDALAALGKSREDASVVTATIEPDTQLVAIAVDGTSGTALLDALTKTWPSIGSIEPTTVGGKAVSKGEGANGTVVYFYVRDSVVYVIEATGTPAAEQVLAALP